ncbi:HET-domain-containing protein [Lepidopterella palustris CBS 459.81]|uniref:HET-domain-containing protein n=1 Tax=Lepidopterella palustris CBS 459.81 TaxID=1314670 RepID=A0A8E2E267_9PEZI|nr:HET-domain-containing protein [Lepidopterella palustris CBS 459.81]
MVLLPTFWTSMFGSNRFLKLPAAHLCAMCKSMFEKDDGVGTSSNPHHQTMLDLESAALQDCIICVTVLDELRRIGSLDSDSASSERPFLNSQFWGASEKPPQPRGVAIYGLKRRLVCEFSLYPWSQIRHPIRPAQNLSTMPDLSESWPDHYIPPSTGDPAVSRLALSWFESCLEKHKNCGRGQDTSWTPLRLLDVSGEEPRLILTESEKPNGPYATMSHCWGPNPSFMRLTATNVEGMLNGISTEQLPENFRNAIEICRRLKLKYLWIDSLCIIQSGKDSENDWLHHLTAMRSIYSNCIINIAATRASNANESCYAERNPEHIRPQIVQCRQSRLSGVEPHLLVYVQLAIRGRQLTPLGSRGWVLQERILSPRVLHFGAKQVFWECSQSHNNCEAYPDGFLCINNPCAPFELPSKDAAPSNAHYELWQELIRNYAACSLTYPEPDKFAAFAGVAEHMASIFQEDYVAGFFRSELPEALLWFVVRETIPLRSPANSSTKYQAPSWSWASTNVPINMHRDYLRKHSLHNLEPTSLATVLGFRVDLVDPDNKFGQLLCAELTLKGRVVDLAWDNTSVMSCPEIRVPQIGYQHNNVFFFFDSEEDFYADQTEVVMLGVVCLADCYVDGLVLRRLKSNGVQKYRRIGKGRLYGNDIPANFIAIEERIISLV